MSDRLDKPPIVWLDQSRLIAAAPDLLEALITLAREEWRDDDDLVLVAARAQAKEAIAKATGMAP